MTLKSLEIPDRIADIGVWLDDQLVSAELAQTIVELELLAGDRLTTVQSLDGVLAGSEDLVLDAGLAKVNESLVRSLLRQPSLLLELQEQVLMHGGTYWQNKTTQAYGRPNITKILASAGVDTVNTSVAAKESQTWTQRKLVGAIAAMAAALLVMLSIWQPWGQGNAVASSGWGFAKSGLLTSDISEDEMIAQLVSASGAWHNKRPDSIKGLEKRLLEFDRGCEALLSSNIPQLSVAKRSAVHQACRTCRDDIATLLVAINRGERLSTIQSNADSAIDRLTRSIQQLG